MGTTIKLECWRATETTDEQWNILRDYCRNTFDDWNDEDSYFSIGTLNCSYSSAYITSQFNKDVRELLKGSGIFINMWYEEREPDESLTL